MQFPLPKNAGPAKNRRSGARPARHSSPDFERNRKKTKNFSIFLQKALAILQKWSTINIVVTTEM